MKNWASLVKRAGLLGLASLFFGEGFAQATDFGTYRKEMNERFDRFQESKQKEFDAFRDSLNEAYTRFLEQKWESFSLFRQERSFRPMPEPPVYTPESPLPDEGAQPPVVENVPVAPPRPVEEPLCPRTCDSPAIDGFCPVFWHAGAVAAGGQPAGIPSCKCI